MYIDHYSGRHWNDVTIEKWVHGGFIRCLETHLPKRYNEANEQALRTMHFNTDWVRFPDFDHWKLRMDLARMGVVTIVRLESGEWLISFLACGEDYKNHCSYMSNDFVVCQLLKAILTYNPFFDKNVLHPS